MAMRKLKKYRPTKFKAKDSRYDKAAADFAVMFIESLCHTKGTWAGKPFELIDWQEQIIRDIFGTLKPNGYRQFNTAYVEIPKKQGKSELAAAVALLLTCGDGEERAEVYGCAADRQQATIVFDVAADMVRMCPALSKRVKILASQKRIIYTPTNSFYQVLSAEAYSKHGFNMQWMRTSLSGTALWQKGTFTPAYTGFIHRRGTGATGTLTFLMIRMRKVPGKWRTLSAGMELKSLPILPAGPGLPGQHGSLYSMDAYWKGWRRSTARIRKQVQISMKRFMVMFSASGRGSEDIWHDLQKVILGGGMVYGSYFYK